jgi:hypothetical protein
MIESSNRSESRSWRSAVPRATRRLSRVAGGVSAAAISTAKTQLLRRDRVADAHHAARLNVCRSCPGGHATLTKHGTPRTCGPMLACSCEGQASYRGTLESAGLEVWPIPGAVRNVIKLV